MAEPLNPFPEPREARLEAWHVKEAESLLIYSDKSFIINIGRKVLRAGSVMVPSHFHRMALRMKSPAEERSFKRGACLGLAFVAIKSDVVMDDDAFRDHFYALNDYRRDNEETMAAAAIRLGADVLGHDDAMASCANYAVFAHPGDNYDPMAMRAGVGYGEMLAEQALNPNALAERAINISSLEAQYGEELAGLFDDIE